MQSESPAGTRSPHATDPGYEDEIDLARLLGVLSVGKWKIAAFVLLALAGAVFYLFVADPIYRADALLQIQSQENPALSGLTEELSQFTGQKNSGAAAEMQIVKSRAVIGETVDALQLTLTARPRYFPVIGEAVSRWREPGTPVTEPVSAEADTWLGQFAWQPTHIEVSRLQLPENLLGKTLTLLALGGPSYQLYAPDGHKLLNGQVGERASGKTEQGGTVSVFVSALNVSHPPTAFTVTRQRWLPVVEGLQQRLGVTEQGRDTGIVQVSLEGEDRQAITEIVNTVAQTYLRQNVEARSQEAEKSLDFLDEQLPELRADLEAAENKLAEYRTKNQAVDLDAEGQALLEQIVALEDKRSQLQLKLAELRQTYTGTHPALESVQEQAQSLRRERRELENQIGDLPEAQKEMLALRRDVEVNTQLYTALLNRAQELRVIKAGTVGNVRIVDQAVEPVRAVSPKVLMVLTLALVLGGIGGCGFVLLRAALRRAVNDPKDIENQLGLPVYAVIPFSSWLARHSQRAKRRGERAPILARDHSDETAVEAVRSLRTSLYFAQMEAGSNAILVTGPAPGVGKSFVSTNLAYLLSEVQQKVVVVDADMRKGRLHEFVEERDREPGLSQVLAGQVALEDALRDLNGSNIKVLTTGRIPPNPSELLMREEFVRLIEQLKKQFDLVIIDAPPILAVTDAAIIAASVPGIVTFMVARAGMHPMQELEESVSRMARHDRKIAGVVFNAYRQEHASYAGGYSYYQYEYKSRA